MTYTFTRNSGGGGSTTYNVSWVGNDGTFSSPGSISLAKGAATTFVVNVNPTTTGAHSALLNLDDPSTAGIDYQTLNTVVVPEVFTAANNYTVTKSGTIGRNQTKSFFFQVPAGTPAFKVDMTGGGAAAGAGQMRFLRFHPYGVGIDSNASTTATTRRPVAARPARPRAGRQRTRSRASGRSRSRPGGLRTPRTQRSR